jgi:NAD(P)-dependent dehydrogenase (short-subunit alcohol dehydrogenase family)
MSTEDQRVAVVSGANRGIGLAVARQLGERGMTVVLGARDSAGGRAVAAELAGRGIDARAHQLDVTDQASVDRLRDWVATELRGRVDVLINNAGIYPGGRAAELDLAVAEEAWQVNALGAWRLTLAILPFMRRRGYGRIVNVSSEAGSLQSMSSYMPAYNVSKAALNAITRVLAGDLLGSGILVNAACPGWVRTDMGGPAAPRSPDEGAASVPWAALLPDGGPTGGFFRDGRALPW